MRVIALCLFLILTVSSQGQSNTPSWNDLAAHYDYNRGWPLDIKELGTTHEREVTVHDISYASPLGGRVPAYLVIPNAAGPFAAILLGHWMKPGSPLANRKEFLQEAIVLARAGAASLLIDAPQVRPGYKPIESSDVPSPQDLMDTRQQVIDMRRGLDLLLSRKDIDPQRLGFVGHSFDAQVGAILGAVDKRVKTLVLMSGGVYAEEEYAFSSAPAMVDMRKSLGADKMRAWFDKYGWSDPAHYVGHEAPASVFLQYGRKDEPFPPTMRHQFSLFSAPKRLAFYDSGHALNSAARIDRAKWLQEHLQLHKVDVAALSRIPQLK